LKANDCLGPIYGADGPKDQESIESRGNKDCSDVPQFRTLAEREARDRARKRVQEMKRR